MAITKEDVWLAAEALAARSERVTMEAIRKIVGSGSFTTIRRHLDEWKAKRALAGVAVPTDVPESIEQLGSQLVLQIWAQASETAERRLAAERELLTEAQQTAEASVMEAVGLADRFDADLGTARERIEELEQHLAAQATAQHELERTLAAEEAMRMKAEALVEKRDQAYAELQRHAEEHLARCSKVEGENQVLVSQNAHLQATVDRMTQRKSPS